jgi:hypothetical protein
MSVENERKTSSFEDQSRTTEFQIALKRFEIYTTVIIRTKLYKLMKSRKHFKFEILCLTVGLKVTHWPKK